MNIKRIQKSKNYSIISNETLRRKDLSLKAKGLMSLILSLPDSWDLTVNGLVEIIKESKNTVYSILKELNKFGYVERNRITDNTGKVVKWELLIYESPHTKKPQLKKPDVENCTQINTDNKINTNLNKIYWIDEIQELNYPKEMKEDFIDYWSEESKTGKTRQSMQKTWNTERRLKTWAKNDKNWNKTKTSKIDAQIDSYVGALNLLEKKYDKTLQ
jgi:predicted transcriptional regulator